MPARRKTHYGETVPPEYADKDREELNKAGRVVNTLEVMTPERRHAKDLLAYANIEGEHRRDGFGLIRFNKKENRWVLADYGVASKVKDYALQGYIIVYC